MDKWTYTEKICYIAHTWAEKENEMSCLQDFDFTDMAKAADEFINSQPSNAEFRSHIKDCFSKLKKECIGENSVHSEHAKLKKQVPVMILCLTGLGDGISFNQISQIGTLLLAEKRYIPVEFHATDTSAYGYIEAGYYEGYNYASGFLEDKVLPVLDNKDLEATDGVYTISDGQCFYMGYFTN